jgi:hypothetical protein
MLVFYLTQSLSLWAFYDYYVNGMYYKQMMIVNDNFSVISKWSSTLIDNARAEIYYRNMFIIQATEAVFLVVCDPSMNELWST